MNKVEIYVFIRLSGELIGGLLALSYAGLWLTPPTLLNVLLVPCVIFAWSLAWRVTCFMIAEISGIDDPTLF